MMEEKLRGLSSAEVLEKQRKGEREGEEQGITKSCRQIIRDNILTLFNILNFMIAGLLLAVGAYSNLLFIGIILLNITIGIAQELKAKKLVDELSLLNRPMVCVRREGEELYVERKDVVKGDLLILESGNQISNDAKVLFGSLEVNESLLTGESDGVVKETGDQLYSGSFVISGRAGAEVMHTGNANYAAKLVDEVKKEKQVQSEMLDSMKKVTNMTSFLIVPLGVLLFAEAFFLRNTTVSDAVILSSAALLGMLPKGLVLLISLSLATGVIRLAKMKILVQNIYSLETLAHVDTLCLDKTGTITDGKLKVCRKICMKELPQGEAEGLIRSYMEACEDNNATFEALKTVFPPKLIYRSVYKIPFSSKRKWGSVSFEEAGTVFVGAPEKLIGDLPENLLRELEQGRRIIAVGYSPEIWENDETLPKRIQVLYAVVLEDGIRRNAGRTLKFFEKQGVDVKIISGDHVKTVSMIAKRAGLDNWAKAVDLSAYEQEPDYDAVCREYAVFARTTPRQKQKLVQALQKQGRQVAMTGDGVNDLLALREADCSIAVADGSDASRQLAQIVLLDSDFTHLPEVVMEGRKVVNNVTRTAGVFFIKTIYSLLVSVFCIIANIPFPFIPIQITLIDAFIEAYPSFITIVESDTRKISGSFLKTAISRALPFGAAAALMIAFVSLVRPFESYGNQTVMYLALILISVTAVVKSCIPLDLFRGFICVTMTGGIFGALAILPEVFHVGYITLEMSGYVLLIMAVVWLFLGSLYEIKHLRIRCLGIEKRWKKRYDK